MQDEFRNDRSPEQQQSQTQSQTPLGELPDPTSLEPSQPLTEAPPKGSGDVQEPSPDVSAPSEEIARQSSQQDQHSVCSPAALAQPASKNMPSAEMAAQLSSQPLSDLSLSDESLGDESLGDESTSEESKLERQFNELQIEKSRWQEEKEILLRQLAEAENLRKRTVRDRINERKYAISGFVKAILAVGDSLQRALDITSLADPAMAQYRKGIELTMQEFSAVLTRFEISKLEPMGKPFDPRCHQAVFEQPDATHPSGTVIQVIQAGYTLHDRLLREAIVGVSKEPPAEAVSDAGSAAEPAAKPEEISNE